MTRKGSKVSAWRPTDRFPVTTPVSKWGPFEKVRLLNSSNFPLNEIVTKSLETLQKYVIRLH